MSGAIEQGALGRLGEVDCGTAKVCESGDTLDLDKVRYGVTELLEAGLLADSPGLLQPWR